MRFHEKTSPPSLDRRCLTAIRSMNFIHARVSKTILGLDAAVLLVLAGFTFAGHAPSIFWAEWLTFNLLAFLLLLGHHPAPRSFEDVMPGGANSGAFQAWDFSAEMRDYATNPRYQRDATYDDGTPAGPLEEAEITEALKDFSGYIRSEALKLRDGLAATIPGAYIASTEQDHMSALMFAAEIIMKKWSPGPNSCCLKFFLSKMLVLRTRTIWNREHSKAYDAASYAEGLYLTAGRNGARVRVSDPEVAGDRALIADPTPARRTKMDFTKKTLKQAIESLAKDEQEFVDLRFFDGCMTLAEIADKLGLTIGKAYNKERKITAKLREFISIASI